jgi:FMN-dependent NADH-azoreductase
MKIKKILYVSACVTREVASRTDRLAQAYLKKRLEVEDCSLSTLHLEDMKMYPLTGKSLAEREKAIESGDFSGAAFEFARNFAASDEIVIAAPYWDMSFPASLKLYLEQLCVNKLTFCYNEKGMPCGLTNIKKVVYLTTSGGYIGNNNFGFDYIRGVFSTLFRVNDISCFSAEGLDIYGNDPEKILTDAIAKMLLSEFAATE